MSAETADWFELVSDEQVMQGDIFESVSLHEFVETDGVNGAFRTHTATLIVLSHSCDIASDKLERVLCCEVHDVSSYPQGHELSKHSVLDEVRKGRYQLYHLLRECREPGHERQLRVVEFSRIVVLTTQRLKAIACKGPLRHRLRSPYREQLSQRYGLLFMRIGLPQDLEPITASSLSLSLTFPQSLTADAPVSTLAAQALTE